MRPPRSRRRCARHCRPRTRSDSPLEAALVEELLLGRGGGAPEQRSVALNEALAPDTLYYAKLHLDIIERFGRFPHRNAPLGRNSTHEEREFLAQGGFSG